MAAVHCGCRFLIKTDLQNFFGSLSEQRVYGFFVGLGYTPLVAFEMARICTYLPGLEDPLRRNIISSADRGSMPYAPAPMGCLPQGAPTSPALSNHLARDLDSSLYQLAARYSLVYSRYADDMAFSSREIGLRPAATAEFLRDIKKTIRRHGLMLNEKKTAVHRSGSRRLVTGLLVDGPEPRLTKRFKGMLEQHLHYSEKFGLAAHAEKRGFDSAFGLIRYLQGLIAFARDIEGDWGKGVQFKFRQITDREDNI